MISKLKQLFTLYPFAVLLFLVAIVFTAWWQNGRIEDATSKAAEAALLARQAHDTAATSAANNDAYQKTIAEKLSELIQQNQQLLNANAVANRAIAQRDQQLTAQKQTDAKAQPVEQSARWQQLVPGSNVEITDRGFAVDPAGGLATLQALEEVPSLAAKVADLQSNIGRLQTVVSNDSAALQGEQAAHAADVKNDAVQLAASKKDSAAIKAEFSDYKKKAHRNMLRAFVGGVVVGAIGRNLLGL